MARPSVAQGTYTFLFTDIEGSTALWQDHPEQMKSALARHDAIVRETIEGAGGQVFKTVGDAFCAAFASAPDAVTAMARVQLGLWGEQWPPETPIRVRTALHTGSVECRDGDFFGQPLNRVARLLSIAHGGQGLVAQSTFELSRDSLPDGVSLREMGTHRLKDLGRPEIVYQVVHPDLPSEFPPLRSLDNLSKKHNLPQQVTSFVGRAKELAEVKEHLAKTRVVTLTGAGGSGKTRLSLQVAADQLEDFSDGVWLVEFAPITDPALVAQTVASALDLKEEPAKPLQTTLVDYLKSKKLLLLFDNCEHQLDACAKLAEAVIRSSAGVKILASSREALGLPGEQTYRIPSLSTPDPRADSTPESLSQYEAVTLFIERAVGHESSFQVTNENAPALASICSRLDGIPLAIELAAARIRSLSLNDIDERLDHRFSLLTGGSRTSLPRQQTLRSLIDWSYDLLTQVEQAQLRRLSVFSGGWTLEAAERVCAGGEIEPSEVLDLLTSLVSKSLVLFEQGTSPPRYRMLETIRQYAVDRQGEQQDGDNLRDLHLKFYGDLIEESRQHLVGPEQGIWLDRLETEHDNVRSALRWASRGSGGVARGINLASHLATFWWVRGYFSEGRDLLTGLLERADAGIDPGVLTSARRAAATLAFGQGDYDSARLLLTECQTILRSNGDRAGLASALSGLGVVETEQGNYDVAEEILNEAVAIAREVGHHLTLALALNNRGVLARDRGDLDLAYANHHESLALRREAGNGSAVAFSLLNLGQVALGRGDLQSAKSLFAESLATRREINDRRGIGRSLRMLGLAEHFMGNSSAARAHLEAALEIAQEVGDRWGIGACLNTFGRIALAEGDLIQGRRCLLDSLAQQHESGQVMDVAETLEAVAQLLALEGSIDAAKVWGVASHYREERGTKRTPFEASRHEESVKAFRTTVHDNEAFQQAWDEGRSLSLDQAVEYVLGPPPGLAGP